MTTTERALDAWFGRQAARERSTVRLEDALLGRRFAAYFVHRLRFFGIRYAAATGVQLVKVLVLHRLLGTTGFLAVIALVATAGLLGGGWWGALEILRARVRVLYRFESPMAVGREVARWIVRAVRVGLVVAVVAVAYLCLRVVVGAGLTPVDLAVAAVLLRSAVDLPIRAYHAGAFALRRVYRPWASILVLEVLGLGSLLVLAPVVGAWAIGVSEIAMAVAFGTIAVRYTARTHRLLGIAPHRLVSVGAVFRPFRQRRGRRGPAPRRTGSAGAAEFGLAALAGMAMSLDSLVVLAAISVGAAARETWLAVLMAGIGPTIRAGFDWSQLVYFDLKRLDAPLFANLRRRLDRASLVLALVLGCLFSAVAVAVAWGPLGVHETAIAVLPPFLLAASVLGLSQMQAFTAGAWPRAILGGVVMITGLVGLRPLAEMGVEPLLVLAVTAAGAVAAVRLGARFGIAGGGPPDILLPTAWLTRLRTETGPVVIGATRMRAPEPKSASGALADPMVLREWRAMQLGRRLAGRAGRRGAVTVIDSDRVAWFVRADPRPAVTSRTVVMEASGRVSELFQARAESGPAALGVVAGWPLFALLRKSRVDAGTADAAIRADAADAATRADAADGASFAGPDTIVADLETEIARRFHAAVRGGIVVRPDRAPPPALAGLDINERRVVLWDAIRHARRLSTRPGHGAWDVTSWCPDGTLGLVFLAPRSAGQRAISRWRRLVRAANLAAASGGHLPAERSASEELTRGGIVGTSTRGSAPPVLAASAATEFRPG